MSLKPLRIVLLGAPGAGKGTQTSRLLKAIPQLSSISTGDLLRNEIAKKSEIGSVASKYIADGKLLPDLFMAQLVTNELRQRNWLNRDASFLLDGFPRTANQAEKLDSELESNQANVNLVVELDVPPSVILDRISNRWVHSSGRVYNLQYNPPKVPFKDDVTGEPLFQRPDDNPETFKVRLDSYFKELAPLKQFYIKKGVYDKVSGDTSDIIFPKLLELIKKRFS
ncbi:hypothetical protein CANARDRAFT_8156 [[Candida] arabinofermentans NRRL YB-2248]|uniref:GTP:AMP phosphotransferase, mitochondrial n=1 Tax=[Candida] arabinofermentans NRRL YB-2248 TaxID=983967 RepID=A0A1E4SZT6_9ASCO|nr:hypothetical protein CANARDRAFT_8156 [[Candida] arabinofermentans NRRL YB-2248]